LVTFGFAADGNVFTWGYGYHGLDNPSLAWQPSKHTVAVPNTRFEYLHLSKDHGYAISSSYTVTKRPTAIISNMCELRMLMVVDLVSHQLAVKSTRLVQAKQAPWDSVWLVSRHALIESIFLISVLQRSFPTAAQR
jgi:hypothetical protein